MTIKKGIAITITAILITLTLISTSFAARAPIIPEGVPEEERLLIPSTPSAEQSEENFLRNVFLPNLTKNFIIVAGGLAFLFVIVGGIQILTAYGNDEKLGSAKKTITFAIVGLLIAMLSYTIVAIISSIQLDNPPPTETSSAETSSIFIKTAHAQSLLPKIEYPEEAYDPETGEAKPSKIAMVGLLPSGEWQVILGNAINIILGITGSLAIIAFTVGGIMMIVTQGNEEEFTKGKNIVVWAIIALVIIATSYAIILGVTQLQFFQ
jgi:FtsH-binding integral membrane protein